MKRMIAAICLLALLGGPAAGQTTTAPAEAAAKKPPTTRPAPTGKEAAKAAKESEETIPAALLEAAKASFVIVEAWFKKDTTESKGFVEQDWRARGIYAEYIDKKRPAETTGLVLDDKGHILIYDEGLEDRFLDKIIVQDVAGGRYPAKPEKLLTGTSGVLLKVDAKAAAKLKPLKFAKLKDEGVNTVLLAASVYKTDDKWRLAVGRVRPAVSFRKGGPSNVFFGSSVGSYYGRRYGPRSVLRIIANEEGQPVGCAVSPRMDLRQKESLWRGGDLLKADGVPWSQLAKGRERIRAQLIKATQEIVIRFHKGGSSGGDSRYSSGEAAGEEITSYGYAISDREILVPIPLDSKRAAKIDKFFVKFSPRDRRPADWVGAYKDVGAFVVRLREGKLPAHLQLAREDLSRMKPFWVARPRKRYGKTYVDLTVNRLQGKNRGFAGKYHWYPLSSIDSGAMLVDFSGKLAGMNLHQRIEHEEERRLERSRSYYGGREDMQRVFLISEIRDEVTKPTAHLDAKIKVKTRTESKRRNWFGVEFVPMNSDLAEQFKVEKPTRDGRVGFLVNAVYPSSPAAKLGLKVGDILLKIQPPGMPYPIELASQFAGGDMGYGYRGRWYPGMSDEGEFGPLEATWKARLNFLTRAFDAMGTGKTVKLIYYRRGTGKDAPGKAITVSYKIELAPPDLESAPKWKNRKLGLTVKDITYEVRLALNLKADAPGVVVARIEPGSPAMIGRIFTNELITTADGKPITSARQLRDYIAAAKKAGKDKVRLTILRLGNTRFTDLTIKAYDKADDEGLEEEKKKKPGPSPTAAPAKS